MYILKYFLKQNSISNNSLAIHLQSRRVTNIYNTYIFKSMYINHIKLLLLRQAYEDIKAIFQLNIDMFNTSK